MQLRQPAQPKIGFTKTQQTLFWLEESTNAEMPNKQFETALNGIDPLEGQLLYVVVPSQPALLVAPVFKRVVGPVAVQNKQ